MTIKTKRYLAATTAALLASAMAIQPVAAQYGPYDNQAPGYVSGDPYYERDQNAPYAGAPANDPYANQPYSNTLDQYQRDRENYERQREEYDRAQAARDQYNNNAPQYGNQYGPPPQNYRVQDDPYYRECQQRRQGNQVAGLIIGGLLGAGLGSTVARGPARGGGTAIGAILGGALGASVGGQLNCDDRNYVYNTYYDGFERDVPRREYRWRNARSGNYGTFYVGDYYQGPRGYRCATYTQTIWVRGRPVPANGHACRQPDGNWVIVD